MVLLYHWGNICQLLISLLSCALYWRNLSCQGRVFALYSWLYSSWHFFCSICIISICLQSRPLAAAERHLESVNHVFQYLYQTVDLHPEYSPRTIADFPIGENQLSGYVNSDRAGCPHNRRSTSGCDLMLNGSAILWRPKQQLVYALSSGINECWSWVYCC